MKLLQNLKQLFWFPKTLHSNIKKILNITENAINCLKNKANSSNNIIWSEVNPIIEEVKFYLHPQQINKIQANDLKQISIFLQSISLILMSSPQKTYIELSDIFKDISNMMNYLSKANDKPIKSNELEPKIEQFNKSINDRINSILGTHDNE